MGDLRTIQFRAKQIALRGIFGSRNGLTMSGSQVAANLGGGLTISGGAIAVNLGSGMTLSGGALTLNVGNGVTISGGVVQANLGNGTTLSGGAITVNLGGGLTMSGAAVAVNGGTGLSVGVMLSIANGGVGPPQISSVNVSQLNAGTMTVGSGGITFSGTGGVSCFGGGNIACSPGYLAASQLYGTGLFGNLIFVNSTGVIDAGAIANFAQLKVQGATKIDASSNAYFNTIYRNGTELDARYAQKGAYTVYDGGGTAIGTVTL